MQLSYKSILINPDTKTIEYITTEHQPTDASVRDQFDRVIPWFEKINIGIRKHFAIVESSFTPLNMRGKASFTIGDKTITGKAIILESFKNEYGQRDFRDPSVTIDKLKQIVNFI